MAPLRARVVAVSAAAAARRRPLVEGMGNSPGARAGYRHPCAPHFPRQARTRRDLTAPDRTGGQRTAGPADERDAPDGGAGVNDMERRK